MIVVGLDQEFNFVHVQLHAYLLAWYPFQLANLMYVGFNFDLHAFYISLQYIAIEYKEEDTSYGATI